MCVDNENGDAPSEVSSDGKRRALRERHSRRKAGDDPGDLFDNMLFFPVDNGHLEAR